MSTKLAAAPRQGAVPATAAAAPSSSSDGLSRGPAPVWTGPHTKWATGDNRFSFPPVPGYTGYIPRSQDYFAKPYVQTTYAALADFQAHKSTGGLPPYLQEAVDTYERSRPACGGVAAGPGTKSPPPHNAGAWSGCRYYSNSTSSATATATTLHGKPKPFISGYTGFVPQLRSHFGEPYAKSVNNAIHDFHARRGGGDGGGSGTVSERMAAARPGSKHRRRAAESPPIPGFTGVRNTRAKPEPPALPPKDLSEQLPVPGYRGHIPGYIFSSETSYGRSATRCLHEFHGQLVQNKEAWLNDVKTSRTQL